MKTEIISVTEAARNFAECINRAHYQDTTFILLKNGEPMARIVPERKKLGSVRELAAALRKFNLSPEEARAWYRDLKAARRGLKPLRDRWRE